MEEEKEENQKQMKEKGEDERWCFSSVEFSLPNFFSLTLTQPTL